MSKSAAEALRRRKRMERFSLLLLSLDLILLVLNRPPDVSILVLDFSVDLFFDLRDVPLRSSLFIARS